MVRLGCLAVILVLGVSLAIPLVAARYLPWWGVVLVIAGQFAFGLLAGPLIVRWVVVRFLMRVLDVKSRTLRGARLEVHAAEAIPRPIRRVRTDTGPGPAPGQSPLPSTPTADPTLEGQSIVGMPEDVSTGTGFEREEGHGDDGEEDELPPVGTWFLRLDCTIHPVARPAGSEGAMQFFDPSDLSLVPFDKKISLRAAMKRNAAEAAEDRKADSETEGSIYDCHRVSAEGVRVAVSEKLAGPQRLELVFQCPPALAGRAKLRYFFESFGDIRLPAH